MWRAELGCGRSLRQTAALLCPCCLFWSGFRVHGHVASLHSRAPQQCSGPSCRRSAARRHNRRGRRSTPCAMAAAQPSSPAAAAAAPPPPPPAGTSQPHQQQQPKSLAALLGRLAAAAPVLSLLLLAAGLAGLLALPLLARPISFDENALLAGSAAPTIRKSRAAFDLGRALAASLSRVAFSPAFSGALADALAARGLAVATQAFNASAAARAAGAPPSCTNVAAALTSPRGDGKEALLLVTPINHQAGSPDFEQHASGLALALALGGALTAHLASSPWLAKEVVWLLPDASCGLVDSVAAWADAYQHPASPPAGAPFGRWGVLQQALVLELPRGDFNRLQASLEAADGQLPKLDMFWLLRWYAWHHVPGAPLELPGTAALAAGLAAAEAAAARLLGGAALPDALRSHARQLGVLLQFMARQAGGSPQGAHAPLKGLMVDAASLRGLAVDAAGAVVSPAGFGGVANTRAPAPARRPPGLVSGDEALAALAELCELVLRSCSVLIERFHHSLFLYVLTGLDGYVSVERYIGPLAALIGLLLLQAAYVRSPPAAQQPGGSVPLRARLQGLLARRAAGSSGGADTQQQAPQRQSGLAAALRSLRGRPTAAVQQHGRRGLLARLLARLEAPEHPVVPAGEALACLPDLLQVPQQVALRQALAQWVGAAQLVALTHAACAAAGLALRHAEQLAPLLLRPGLAAQALAAAPGEHAGAWGAAAGVLVALLLASEATVTAGGSSQGGSADGGCRVALMRRVLVVELSVAACAMAGVACVNWALAYVTVTGLVPLALGCVPGPPASSSSAGAARRLAVLLACSPPVVLAVLAAAGAGPLWLLTRARLLSCMMFWGVWAPCWALMAWAVGVQLQAAV